MVAAIVTEDDVVQYLNRYPQEVTFGDEPAEAVFDRYHAPEFEMVNDGVALDRRRLLDHVRPARKRVAGIETEVHDVLIDGDRVAARYRLIARMVKGSPVVTDIYMFGRLAADGRMLHAYQATRILPS
ncbi:nuclear transport factor 2 family protein [Hamadaea tsunoensis]|uniref:nuclear transport factor 2 family protein n=1 Tax=Hamadaea tsunoensis TaxID=53368 RepID=UPI00054E4D4D|nr:nuclear transport factor 2 family protein [Hamadaea tsunoensis]